MIRSGSTIVAILLVLTIRPAAAQYFGQNKVQYDDFDFRVLQTEHMDIYYYERERPAVEEAARLAERWYARLTALLDHQLTHRQIVILYASHADFRQTTAISGMIGETTGGVTDLLKQRVVMPFTGSLQETDHVLGHELVHAFQFDMGGQRASTLPLWFVEGMAEYLSLGPRHPQTAMWLRDAALHDELPTFRDLDDPRFFPYRFGHAAWAYLAGRFGDATVARIYRTAVELGDPLSAIAQLTELTPDQLSAEWHESIEAQYALSMPTLPGRLLVGSEDPDDGNLHVGPSLSPDGRRLVFYSQRDILSIDMFLADATTGEVLRKFTETATDPHFESLQWVDSTGDWAPSGRQFVFTAIRSGTPTLTIVDVETGETDRRIELPEFGAAFNPAWSPDGRYIAFSGLREGLTDLYAIDLETGAQQQLTHDVFTELQPAWSPDGGHLAFVTDRFTSSLERLAFGEYRIAVLDLDSGAVAELPGFSNAKNINPQWIDRHSLYFIADPDGISNVYRINLAGDLAQITAVATGIAGITALSPALSIATATGVLAFTIYDGGNHNIRLMARPAPIARTRAANANAGVLPPFQPDHVVSAPVAAMLRRTAVGLPPEGTEFPTRDYDPGLSLDFIGTAASSSVGVDGFGTFLGGGVTFLFSDVLGRHTLSATAQLGGRINALDDFAGQVGYLNQASRWAWGVFAEQVPYTTATFQTGLTDVDGTLVIVDQELRRQQIDREAGFIAQYPFSVAQRLELRTAYRHVGFDRARLTRIIDPTTGRLLGDDTETLSAAESLSLGQSTAALVYDTAAFGPTAPVRGTRYRLEVSPVYGSLQFTEVLLDARRYFMPKRPLTVATRVLHFGRYGGDAGDSRLSPLFLGFPTLVRGYDVGSFSAGDCAPDGRNHCPAVDRLLGTRLGVANLELRFPLVGLFTGQLEYGPLPAEGFLFADTGIAWSARQQPALFNGTREFVTSVGAGVRVSLLGFAVGEFNMVRPLDRPDDGWHFVFSLRPGF